MGQVGVDDRWNEAVEGEERTAQDSVGSHLGSYGHGPYL